MAFLGARRVAVIILKLLASVPLALLMGSMAFKILHEGTWLFGAVLWFLPQIVFDALAGSAQFVCWIAAYVVIVRVWIFEPK